MPSSSTRRACTICRRRKVKCDGLPTCRNCQAANAPCQYPPPRRRGPKPAKLLDNRPRQPLNTTSPAADQPREAKCLASPTVNVSSSSPVFDSSLVGGLSPSLLFEPPDIQSQTVVRVHLELLTGLSAASPPITAATIADQCISLYTQYVFGAIPICHEATLRAGVSRFFIPFPIVRNTDDDHAWALHSFAADDEQERFKVLRNFTLLTALCAVVSYAVPETLLPSKQLTAQLFLRASRNMLAIYEDYDLEQPNSSSLSIRLLLSSAIQQATGKNGLSINILNQAGLLAMRMRLYDETSLEGKDPIEETILRNAFWQLYVCDKTAMVMRNRPVMIHETLFETAFTLKTHSTSSVPLFDHIQGLNGSEVENRLLEGFHVIRRLWTIAADVTQAMKLKFSRSLTSHAVRENHGESISKLSEAYLEMINLTNNFPVTADLPGESPIYSIQVGAQHPSDILQRQRTTYLLTIHTIKIFLLNSAIQCDMPQVMGLSAEPQVLAIRQIELTQDFINTLKSVPFLHLQAEGEHCYTETG
ncbi:C6 transcription factor [Colletotrichum truncatum]|uniref:C6 transcription factor n=1 Tax=Colletotrichum truncatum TaxID=5467 RepID=A0ACC3ZL51_COLTU